MVAIDFDQAAGGGIYKTGFRFGTKYGHGKVGEAEDGAARGDMVDCGDEEDDDGVEYGEEEEEEEDGGCSDDGEEEDGDCSDNGEEEDGDNSSDDGKQEEEEDSDGSNAGGDGGEEEEEEEDNEFVHFDSTSPGIRSYAIMTGKGGCRPVVFIKAIQVNLPKYSRKTVSNFYCTTYL